MSRGKNITIREAGLAVVRRLREKGHDALWAGGCVRDMLLGADPVDIDVATDARPDRIIELFRTTRKVGAQFGVVLVRQGGHWIETATFRSDVDYEDGRHPVEVVFTTAEEDAKRRDFTINGLFYDPIGGRVIDYVGGQRDLEAKVIRAIGAPAERFAEDHLRMMRAVRFSARLGFPIEPTTTDAIREHADKLTRISRERVREELEKMLIHAARAGAVRQLMEIGLFRHLWPDADWQPEQTDLAIRVLSALPGAADFALALAGLLHACSPRETVRITRSLKCSNRECDDVSWLVGKIDEIHHGAELSLPAFKRVMAHERFGDLLELHRAVCTARVLSLDANDAARQRAAAIPADQVAPPPFVTGDDLIALGLTPGPRFKEILDELYDRQLDNQLATRDDALTRLKEITKKVSG